MTGRDEDVVIRSWTDDATGWSVEERRPPIDPETVIAELRDPNTGECYWRVFCPHNRGHLISVQRWVELVKQGARAIIPPSEPHLRRAQRVLSMVHELHKWGFQRLRIAPYMRPIAWRCEILPRSETLRTHGALSRTDSRWALYSSGQDNEYFGWKDARSDSARQLARKFLERFPHVVEAGAGEDWEYSGWYSQMLGAAERGAIPSVYSEYAEPSFEYVRTIKEDVRIPMPPPGEWENK